MMQCKPSQRFVQRKQSVVCHRAGNFKLIDVAVRRARPSALGFLPTRAGDEKAADRLGGCSEKVGAVLPALGRRVDQSEPGFVNEGGGLKGMVSGFVRHLGRRKSAQFVISQRQERFGCLVVPVLHADQDPGDVAHKRTLSEIMDPAKSGC
jgi:hypothetical protein